LTVKRDGQNVDFAMIRQQIKIKGVTSGVLNNIKTEKGNGDVGYVKIRQFSTSTRDEVMHALEDIHTSRNQKPLKSLVIDVRGNGGGSLQGGIDTANLLLNPGKMVVYVVGKDGNGNGKQTLPNGVPSSDPDLPDTRTPLYILVDSNTASAAEVFAAAMKENNRARVVGEKTFGKGIIQNLQPLSKGGVAVTVAKYETPNHNNINGKGIDVDISISCPPDLSTAECIPTFVNVK
jgi:carboxyl-terminal processing protease